MTNIYKLFFVSRKPYLTIDEDVKVGDRAIVSVSDLYPTLVECMNEDQINIFQKPKTSSTKRYKVVYDENNYNFDKELISSLMEKELPSIIKIENDKFIVVDEN
jgi:hypothetical protein